MPRRRGMARLAREGYPLSPRSRSGGVRVRPVVFRGTPIPRDLSETPGVPLALGADELVYGARILLLIITPNVGQEHLARQRRVIRGYLDGGGVAVHRLGGPASLGEYSRAVLGTLKYSINIPALRPGLARRTRMSSMPDRAEQPANDMNDAIGPDVDIPGPYPTSRGDATGEAMSSEPEPTKATRDAGSLGDLTEEDSTSTMREGTGGLGSPMYDEESAAEEA